LRSSSIACFTRFTITLNVEVTLFFVSSEAAFQIFVMGIVPDTTSFIDDQILGQDIYRTRRAIFLVRLFSLVFVSYNYSTSFISCLIFYCLFSLLERI
jgi:hypothetical protein